MRRASRKPSSLSESLHHQINSYALAASAVGMGVLALTQPAQGRVVYTKCERDSVKEVARLPTEFTCDLRHLDLDNDGIADFGFARIGNTSNRTSYLKVRPLKVGNGLNVPPLSYGIKIGMNLVFQEGVQRICFGYNTESYHSSGPWAGVQNGYMGFRFLIRRKTHYGWARISVAACRPSLTGYAYETIPNKPIIAGKTEGPDVIMVEPGSLGVLAAGAPRSRAVRK